MTDIISNGTRPNKVARRAGASSAIFTISGLLIASSATVAVAGIQDSSSEHQIGAEQVSEVHTVVGDYLIIEHEADAEQLNNLTVGSTADWNISISLNPDAFAEEEIEDGVRIAEDNAELFTFLSYDSDFGANIDVESPRLDVIYSVDVDDDTEMDESFDVGEYELSGMEDSIDVTVGITPDDSLVPDQSIEVLFSVVANGEWLDITPPEEPVDPDPTDEPTLEPIDPSPTDDPEPSEDPSPTDEPTETPSPTDEPTDPVPTDEPTDVPSEDPTDTETPSPTPTDEPTETETPSFPTEDAVEPTTPGIDVEFAQPTEGTSGDDDSGAVRDEEPMGDSGQVDQDGETSPRPVVPADSSPMDRDRDFDSGMQFGDGSQVDSPTTGQDGDSGGAFDSQRDSGAGNPTNINTGFMNEFSTNPASISLFLMGLIAIVGGFALKRREIRSND